MTEKDKYADEMLTDEELDGVAGGSWTESNILGNILPRINKRYDRRLMNATEMQRWLKDNLNIDAKIYDGGCDERSNVYTLNGETISHNEVCQMCRDYLSPKEPKTFPIDPIQIDLDLLL